MSIEQVIGEAKRLLEIDPFDAGHDLDHHTAVVKNCFDIIRDENLSLGIEALLIAAWWHDYKRDDETENDRILTVTLVANGFDNTYIAKVLGIKNCHSFGNGQDSLEAQVLFDADKLEYVNIDRFKKVSQAVEKGKMSMEVAKKYEVAFIQRVPILVGNLHFASSNRKFNDRLLDLGTNHYFVI